MMIQIYLQGSQQRFMSLKQWTTQNNLSLLYKQYYRLKLCELDTGLNTNVVCDTNSKVCIKLHHISD